MFRSDSAASQESSQRSCRVVDFSLFNWIKFEFEPTLKSSSESLSISEKLPNHVDLASFPTPLTHTIPFPTAKSTECNGLSGRGEVPFPGPSQDQPIEWFITSTPL